MAKSNNEFKVGLFVMAALGVLTYLVVKAGDLTLEPGYLVRFVFGSVAGVEVGSPVRLAGVPVGEIKGIRVVRNTEGRTQVEITAWITQGTFIEEDAHVSINSIGLLGDKYVEVTPGSGGMTTIGDGGTLVGYAPQSMEKITDAGGRLITKLENAVDNINSVVADPEFKNAVRGTFVKAEGAFGKAQGAMDNADEMMRNLKMAGEDLKDAAKSARIVLGRLRDGEGTVGRLLTNDRIAKDLEAFVADIKANPWKLLKKG